MARAWRAMAISSEAVRPRGGGGSGRSASFGERGAGGRAAARPGQSRFSRPAFRKLCPATHSSPTHRSAATGRRPGQGWLAEPKQGSDSGPAWGVCEAPWAGASAALPLAFSGSPADGAGRTGPDDDARIMPKPPSGIRPARDDRDRRRGRTVARGDQGRSFACGSEVLRRRSASGQNVA